MRNFEVVEQTKKAEEIKAGYFSILSELNSSEELSYSVYSLLFDEFEKVSEELLKVKSSQDKKQKKKNEKYSWVPDGEHIKCPKCDFFPRDTITGNSEFSMYYENGETTFCPNCGIRLKEEL